MRGAKAWGAVSPPPMELGAPKKPRGRLADVKAVAKIVQEMELPLTDEQVKTLDEKVRENYVTRSEHEEKLARIQTLTEQVEHLNESLESTEGAEAKIKALEEQVKAFEDAEAERKSQEEEQAAIKVFVDEFDAAVGEKQFANAVTRQHILTEAFNVRKDNPSMKAEDILDQVVGDQNGIWANPQAEPAKQPVASGKDSSADTARYVSQLFGKN